MFYSTSLNVNISVFGTLHNDLFARYNQRGCTSSLISVTAAYRLSKIVSEYDKEILQSQTIDNPMASREESLNHQETPGRQNKQSNQLSLPHQDDCNTRMDIK